MLRFIKPLYGGFILLACLGATSSCTHWSGEVLESQYQYPIVPDPVYSFQREGASSVDTQLSQRVASASSVLYSRFLRLSYLYSERSWTELVSLFDQGGNNQIALRPLLVTSSVRQGERARYLSDFTKILEQAREAAGYENGMYSTTRYHRSASAGVTGFVGFGQGDDDRVFVTGLGLAPGEQYRGMLLGAIHLDRLLWVDLEEEMLRDSALIKAHENLVLLAGHNYTELEHRWDEAYGFYTELEREVQSTTLSNLPGIGTRIHDAFALGRRAITEYRYQEALAHLKTIRQLVSQVVARRAIEELYGRNTQANLEEAPRQAFRFISRGVGFVYALQFTRRPSGTPYLTQTEVTSLLAPLMQGEGLWSTDLSQKLETLTSHLQQVFDLPHTK